MNAGFKTKSSSLGSARLVTDLGPYQEQVL